MPGTAFNSASWSGYDEATVTNPSSAVTDFTLLIDVSTLSASWKAAVQSDGADIRLTKGDGTTELAYDLIAWAYNAGAPTGWLRVLWSGSLASTGSQLVRVWSGYTGGAAVAYGATETYGSDNGYDASWLGYWPDGGVSDRTSNGYDLTQVASPGTGTVKGFAATDYNGSTQYAYTTSLELDGRAAVTLMCWFNLDALTCSLCGQWGHSTALQRGLLTVQSDGDILAGWRLSGGSAFPRSTASASTSTDTHAAATTTSGSQACYLNGGADGTASASGTIVDPAGTEGFTIGCEDAATSPSGFVNGRIAEAQAHSAARSSAWIATEYAQSNDQATFWGTWAWTAVVTAVTRAFAGDGVVAAGAGTRAVAF